MIRILLGLGLLSLLCIGAAGEGGDDLDADSIFKKLAREEGEELDIPQSHNLFNPLPPLWDQVKPLSRKNYPANAEGALQVDVWDYLQRMSLYKELLQIKHCEWANYDGKLASLYDLGNILWGLPLQHGWQFSSGRLLTSSGSTEMSQQSWWAVMNYYLSVIPYLGAVQAGLAPQIEALNTPEGFCRSVGECPQLTSPWRDYFLYVNDTAENCSKESTRAFSPLSHVIDSMDFNLSYSMEVLLEKLWGAHINSIDYALPLYSSLLSYLPPKEVSFAQAWGGTVDFIGASLLPCNATLTSLLQHTLPQQMLSDSYAPSRLERRGVILVEGIYAVNSTTRGGLERWWGRGMCLEEGRAVGREMMVLGLFLPRYLVQGSVELEKMIRSTPADATCGV